MKNKYKTSLITILRIIKRISSLIFLSLFIAFLILGGIASVSPEKEFTEFLIKLISIPRNSPLWFVPIVVLVLLGFLSDFLNDSIEALNYKPKYKGSKKTAKWRKLISIKF